jgi:putative PIN family toxin of toxin-antitoxin system
MPVVLDTNVLASIALTPPGSKLSIIAAYWQLELLHVYVSEPILTELERTLSTTPYFYERLSPEKIHAYLQLVRENVTAQEITTVIDHEDLQSKSGKDINIEDDVIIATAIDAKAKYLVTGDKALAKLWRYEGVMLISPADFVAVLARIYPHAV